MTLDYTFVQTGEFALPFYSVISGDVFLPDSGKVLKLEIGHLNYNLKSKKWKFTALQGIWYGGGTMQEIAEKLEEVNKNTAKQRIFGFL